MYHHASYSSSANVTFSTSRKLNSYGVERPKMVIDNLQSRLVLVNLFDLSGKARERARLDPNDLADLVRELRFRFLGRDLDVVNDLVDLGLRQRCRRAFRPGNP